jgi:hypothetical protein
MSIIYKQKQWTKLPRYLYKGDQRDMTYSSYLVLTSAQDGVSGQRHASAALYPRYPLDRRLGGSQSWSGLID